MINPDSDTTDPGDPRWATLKRTGSRVDFDDTGLIPATLRRATLKRSCAQVFGSETWL